MRCDEIRQLIDEGKGFDAVVKEHLETCPECRSYLETGNRIADLFSSYSIEDDDKNGDLFEAQLLGKLEAAKKPVKKPATYRWIAVAAVVALFVSVSVISYFSSVQENRELISSTTSAINEPIRIVMEYESDADYKDVKVYFTLDEGVEFYSENEDFRKMKSYAWRGDLNKGVNQIPFVVEVMKKGKWKIMTDARFNGLSHKHSIELDTEGRKVAVTMYRLSPEKI